MVLTPIPCGLDPALQEEKVKHARPLIASATVASALRLNDHRVAGPALKPRTRWHHQPLSAR